jgi:hypothetical protein
MSKEYNSLESMSLTVKVTPTAAGSFDAVIQEIDPDKASKLGAIVEYMKDTSRDLGGNPITVGGSSKGGKSKKARRTKGGKSKKARKGKSLRRK